MSVSSKTPNQTGFSLIEALVATAILALGLLAVLGAFPLAMRVNKEAERASLASIYARSKLEQLLTTSYDDVATGTIEPRARLSADPASPAYTLERQTVVTLVDADLNTSVSDVGLKKFTVTVFWPGRQGGGSKSLTLTSILAQH